MLVLFLGSLIRNYHQHARIWQFHRSSGSSLAGWNPTPRCTHTHTHKLTDNHEDLGSIHSCWVYRNTKPKRVFNLWAPGATCICTSCRCASDVTVRCPWNDWELVASYVRYKRVLKLNMSHLASLPSVVSVLLLPWITRLSYNKNVHLPLSGQLDLCQMDILHRELGSGPLKLIRQTPGCRAWAKRST